MKRGIGVLLICCLLLAAIPAGATGGTVMASGTVGPEGAPWRLYSNGIVVVDEGLITEGWSQWFSYKADIHTIIFTGPITAGPYLQALFSGLENLHTIEGLEHFDTRNVTDMSGMFSGTAVTRLDLSSWDTNNVTDMLGMFSGAQYLTNLNLSDWDTRNVTDMSRMFFGAQYLTNLNLSGWDTSSVTQMNSMFARTGITRLDLSSWDTRNVTCMHGMFFDTAATHLNLSGWDTRNVGDMSSMFSNSAVVRLDLSSWDTRNVTDMSRMFLFADITSLDLSNWDTRNVTDMNMMFYAARYLTSLDISGFDTRNVTDMSFMFADSGLTNLDLSGWDTRNVTDMSYMFLQARDLAYLDLSGWDTRNVTSMTSMFSGADAVACLDVSSWDTRNVTCMFGMFTATAVTRLDLSGWDTSNVTSMGGMFSATRYLTSLDISGFDTRNVKSMSHMFAGTALSSLDLSGFNTHNVSDMQGMFRDTRNLATLNLSGWDTRNVTFMLQMFLGATSLIRLDLSGFDTRSVTYMDDMFQDTWALRMLTLGPNFRFIEGDRHCNNTRYIQLPAVPLDGRWQNMGTGTILTPAGKHEFTSNELVAHLTNTAMADTWVWQDLFADLSMSHWAVDSIIFTVINEMMEGTSTDTFEPETTLTRAQLVTVLHRMAGSPRVTFRNVFTDVSDGRWYSDTVIWAYEAGVVEGVSRERFAPRANLTREQFATMLHRFAKVMEHDMDVPMDFCVSEFRDYIYVSDWATESMYWANHNELITGTTATTLSPQGTATRAQCATILQRFVTAFG